MTGLKLRIFDRKLEAWQRGKRACHGVAEGEDGFGVFLFYKTSKPDSEKPVAARMFTRTASGF